MKKTLAILALSSIVAAGSAGAATLDFVAEAAGNERGVADGTVINFGGLDVTFNANGTNFAYFDDLSGGKPAGLGVCKVLTGGDQCTPSNDDNVTAGEAVTLSFTQAVNFMVTSFNDADHNSLAGSVKTLLIGVNGAAGVSISFADALATQFNGISSITFAYGGTNADQFYVGGATAVPTIPLPATAPLLVGALGLMGLARRRRKQAA